MKIALPEKEHDLDDVIEKVRAWGLSDENLGRVLERARNLAEACRIVLHENRTG